MYFGCHPKLGPHLMGTGLARWVRLFIGIERGREIVSWTRHRTVHQQFWTFKASHNPARTTLKTPETIARQRRDIRKTILSGLGRWQKQLQLPFRYVGQIVPQVRVTTITKDPVLDSRSNNPPTCHLAGSSASRSSNR